MEKTLLFIQLCIIVTLFYLNISWIYLDCTVFASTSRSPPIPQFYVPGLQVEVLCPNPDRERFEGHMRQNVRFSYAEDQ